MIILKNISNPSRERESRATSNPNPMHSPSHTILFPFASHQHQKPTRIACRKKWGCERWSFKKYTKNLPTSRKKNTNNFLLYYFVFFPQQKCVYTCYVAAWEKNEKIETFEKNWLNVSWIIFFQSERRGKVIFCRQTHRQWGGRWRINLRLGISAMNLLPSLRALIFFSSQQESEWRQQQKNDCEFFLVFFVVHLKMVDCVWD